MYGEENNNSSGLKKLILKVLLILLIIFIIIWLFPTKDYVSNLIDKKLNISENQVFNDNVNTMKEAALSYYTASKLPQQQDKITLEEMLNQNLLIEFTDSKGKTCDIKKSYVEITNNKDDYKMKVNLVCSDKEAYIISYIGSYDYCPDGVCEKKKLTENEENIVEQTSNECKYIKTSGYYTNYGNWSNWTTTKENSSNTKQIQTKVEQIKVGEQTVQSGTTTQKSNPKKITYSNGAVVYECSDEYENAGIYMSPKHCIKTIPKYEKKDIYQSQTYYRYRTRSYVNNINDYKWDKCDNSELIQKGYIKTEETR